MTLTIPHTIANEQVADGNKLGANFAAISTWATATDTAIASTTATGVIQMFADGVIPSGYILCDGRAVSRSTYAALFALVGTRYGAGDGSTTFNVPNMKGRVPVGLDAAVSVVNALGKVGGSRDSIIPNHTHPLTGTAASAGAHDHTVDINHNHGAFNASVNPPSTTVAFSGGGAAGGKIRYWSNKGVPDSGTADLLVTNGGTGDMTVSVDIAAFNASIDVPALGATTATTVSGGAHTHSVSGTTSNPTGGVAVTDTNMQPFLVLNFIIKT